MAKSGRRGWARDRSSNIAREIKPPSDPELAALREEQILPILNNLTSLEPKRRSGAATAIENLVDDVRCRKLLLREQIVRILLEQIITDSALESRVAGWGILRNLASEEDAGFCIHLYRHDILTAIQGTVQNILETIESHEQPVSKLPKTQQSLVWVLSDSIIGLVSSLAAAKDEILDAISNIPIIIRLLFGLLGPDFVPESLFLDALRCLATLTDENEQLAKQIIDHERWLNGLIQLREVGHSKAVVTCGVLHNIFSAMHWFDHNTPIDGVSDAILISTLTKYFTETQNKLDFSNGSTHSIPDQILQLALEITASIATNLQEALEHASHNEEEFKGFDDDDIIIEESGSSLGEEEGPVAEGEEEIGVDEMDADIEIVIGSDFQRGETSNEGHATLDALVRSAAPAILSVFKALGSSHITKTNALSALNNITWTVSSIDLTAIDSRFSVMWVPLAQRIWADVISPTLISNTADISLASSTASLAWALARSVQGKLNLQTDEQRKFMALYQASKDLPSQSNIHSSSAPTAKNSENSDAFQGLGVKCIGVLGRLALDPAPIPLNREIGIFLITILSALPETFPADAIEAMNQIFDVYADKKFSCDEAVFWADGFYKHLESILPSMRNMAKSIDKRKSAELRERADEAVLNLGRFLAYKRKERTSA